MAWSLFQRQKADRSRFAPAPLFTPDTKAVQSAMVLALLEGAEPLGYTREQILANVPLSDTELIDDGSRVSWNTLAFCIRNLETAGASLADLERVGAVIAKSPHLLVERFVGFIVRPEQLLYLGLRWVGPSQFPVLDHELDYRGRQMTFHLTLPPKFPGSAGYFHICRGTLAAIPTVVGHPPAIITGPITPHSAAFEIEVRPYRSSIGRLRRAAQVLRSASSVVNTLERQERQLRRSFEASIQFQRQFRQMIDALPDAVLIYHSGVVVYANPELPRLLGFEHASQLIGKRWSELLHADDLPRAPAEPDERVDLRFLRRDHSSAILELSAGESIQYEDESACIVVARDISDRQALQQKMAVADRMTSLGTLAAGLTHEINNPLMLVMSNLLLVHEEGDRMTAAERSERLLAAMEGAERIKQLSRDLKIFSQPQQDQPVHVDLIDVVRSTLTLVSGQLKARTTLTEELEVGLPAVMASRGRVGQVLLNVLINALHALPDRPISQNSIHVRLFGEGSAVVVEVEDNGSGMPADVQGRVFEPFYSTKKIADGTGLGLAVAKEIVDGYKGTITFSTEREVGTTFRIALPAAEDEVTASPGPPRVKLVSGPCSGRVLAIDDDLRVLEAVTAILEATGRCVVAVSSGDEAMELLERDQGFDVIVCDVMMSPRSGADVHAFLSALDPTLAERMVFMTGGILKPETRSFLAGVRNECVLKPFTLDDLSQAVGRTIAPSGVA